jgi:hypothetical protein
MTDQPVLTDVQLRLMNTLAAERLAATEGRDAWRQGWHARASWSTVRAGWQAKGTDYGQTSASSTAPIPSCWSRRKGHRHDLDRGRQGLMPSRGSHDGHRRP